MLCNIIEYKRMDQDVSLGQLYDVQNKINILYKALVGPFHFLQQFRDFQFKRPVSKKARAMWTP
jgi:hypothetical protein